MGVMDFKPKWNIHLKDHKFVSHKEVKPMEQYLEIKFRRGINPIDDFISPGGYEVEFKDGKRIRFDFTDYRGSIDENDNTVLKITHSGLDLDSFPDASELFDRDVKDIVKIIECFVYTGELEKTKIKPVKILSWSINGNDLPEEAYKDYKIE